MPGTTRHHLRRRIPRCRWEARPRGADRRCSRNPVHSGKGPTARRDHGTCRVAGYLGGGPAAPRRRWRYSVSPIRSLPVARDSCSKRGPPIRAPSSCSSSTRLASGQKRAVLPGRDGRHQVDLGFSTGTVRPGSGACAGNLMVDRVFDSDAIESHLPVPKRLDQFKGQRSGTEHTRLAVRSHRIVDRPGPNRLNTRPSAGDVDLDVVRLPLVRHRFHTDPWQTDLGAAVPNPRVDRFAHLRILGLGSEHELATRLQLTR